MVGNTLQVGEQVCQHKAQLNGAFAVGQTVNVVVLNGMHQLVNYLLQWLYFDSCLCVAIAEGIHGNSEDIFHCGNYHIQLLL